VAREALDLRALRVSQAAQVALDLRALRESQAAQEELVLRDRRVSRVALVQLDRRVLLALPAQRDVQVWMETGITRRPPLL
jgi:hypothetical protein